VSLLYRIGELAIANEAEAVLRQLIKIKQIRRFICVPRALSNASEHASEPQHRDRCKILVREGTDMGSGGRKSPSGIQGQSPGGGLGASPHKPEECYVMRLIKTTYGEKNNKSIQADIV